jgi:hypothetical protein
MLPSFVFCQTRVVSDRTYVVPVCIAAVLFLLFVVRSTDTIGSTLLPQAKQRLKARPRK